MIITLKVQLIKQAKPFCVLMKNHKDLHNLVNAAIILCVREGGDDDAIHLLGSEDVRVAAPPKLHDPPADFIFW